MNWFNMLSIASRKPEGPILSPHKEFEMVADGEGLGFKYSDDFYTGIPSRGGSYRYKEIFNNLVPGDTVAMTLTLWKPTSAADPAVSPNYFALASGLQLEPSKWTNRIICINSGRFRNENNSYLNNVTEYTYTYTVPDSSIDAVGFKVNKPHITEDGTHTLTDIKSIKFVLN